LLIQKKKNKPRKGKPGEGTHEINRKKRKERELPGERKH